MRYQRTAHRITSAVNWRPLKARSALRRPNPRFRAMAKDDLLPGAGQTLQQNHETQIAAGDVDQTALVQVLPTAKPSPAHVAAVEDQREAAFDELGARLERRPGEAEQQTGPVVDHGAAGAIVPVPA